eukprot:1159677-Pelagomonas_calceolata.AAC.5
MMKLREATSDCGSARPTSECELPVLCNFTFTAGSHQSIIVMHSLSNDDFGQGSPRRHCTAILEDQLDMLGLADPKQGKGVCKYAAPGHTG